jgi:hypothetical protein
VSQHNTTAGSLGTSTTRLVYVSATQTLGAGPDTATGTPAASGPHLTYTVQAGFEVTQVTDQLGRVRAKQYNPQNLQAASFTVDSGPAAWTTNLTDGANDQQSLTQVQNPGGRWSPPRTETRIRRACIARPRPRMMPGGLDLYQSDGRCTKETGGSDSCCCRPRLRAGSVSARHGQFELGTRETAEEFW